MIKLDACKIEQKEKGIFIANVLSRVYSIELSVLIISTISTDIIEAIKRLKRKT